MSERVNLAEIQNRAEKFIAAHDEMCRIDQGVGGLAVERPDLMPDFDAWYHASDVEHADTVIALIEALTPRTITTAEELDALPGSTVVKDELGQVFEKQETGQWNDGPHDWLAFDGTLWDVDAIHFPATVIYEPNQP